MSFASVDLAKAETQNKIVHVLRHEYRKTRGKTTAPHAKNTAFADSRARTVVEIGTGRYLHRCLWQVSRQVVFLSWEPFRRLCCSSCLGGTAQCCDNRTGRTDGELGMSMMRLRTWRDDDGNTVWSMWIVRCARAHTGTGTGADNARVTVTSRRAYL
jgi:hypothetical protein